MRQRGLSRAAAVSALAAMAEELHVDLADLTDLVGRSAMVPVPAQRRPTSAG